MPEWLTYAQAGERFGMSADAVRMRAHRLGWRMQPGNDGRTLILVPDDAAIEPRTRQPAQSAARSDERSPAQDAEIARLMALLTAADVRVEKADLRAELAERKAEQAENRVDSAEADRRAADARADAATARADAAVARADAAETRADRAEQGREGERRRADALRDRLDLLQA